MSIGRSGVSWRIYEFVWLVEKLRLEKKKGETADTEQRETQRQQM